MFRRALLCALVLSLTIVAPALASPRSDHIHRHHTLTSWADDRGDRGVHNRDDVWRFYSSRDDSADDDSDSSDSGSDGADDSDTGDSTTDTTSDSAVAETGTQASLGGALSTGAARTITASLSGYSFQDNTPAGSAIISMPVIHSKAGGTGTFADPITTAVPGSSSSPETPKGTRIYVARLKRYFVVEDSGATKEGVTHFDLYVGGEGFSKSASDRCMNSYTSKLPVIINPAAGLPVTVGPLTGPNGCVV